MSEIDNVLSAITAGETIGKLRAAADVHRVDQSTTPFLVVPSGFGVQSLESHLPAPLAVRSVVTLADAASFVAYVNRFKDADTVVFADLDARKFEAVIDYHKAASTEGPGARWGKHRAKFDCQTTTVWDEWTDDESDRKPKGQVEFARFIEEHIPHIASPSGGLLLEICLTLEAKKDVQFRSSNRLSDGQHQFRYEETIQGQAGAQAGTVQIPNAFVVAIEPIRGVGLKSIPARFRYRINNGQLTMWYELVRRDDVLDAAFEQLVSQMRTDLGETAVLVGAAPSIA